MSSKIAYVGCIVLMLSLVGDVYADAKWTDTTGDHLWSTPGNWSTGTLNMTGGSIMLRSILRVVRAGPGYVNLDGGIVTANNFGMRLEPGAVGTMFMKMQCTANRERPYYIYSTVIWEMSGKE